MVKFVHKGNFKNTEKFLKAASDNRFYRGIERLCQEGVEALESATPVDTGMTAGSWSYEIDTNKNGLSIYWKNSNVNHGILIAILIQYGHGTGTGGYVQGRDFINPAVQPIFDKITEKIWKEVKQS